MVVYQNSLLFLCRKWKEKGMKSLHFSMFCCCQHISSLLAVTMNENDVSHEQQSRAPSQAGIFRFSSHHAYALDLCSKSYNSQSMPYILCLHCKQHARNCKTTTGGETRTAVKFASDNHGANLLDELYAALSTKIQNQ